MSGDFWKNAPVPDVAVFGVLAASRGVSLVIRMPFVLRRPWLLVRDLFVNRDDPDLEALRQTEDPETFVWRILPHAARTFSASIALLPGPIARATAVAYLYCRTIDTYEDMIPDRAERERALHDFANRFGGTDGDRLAPAASVDASLANDARDRTHVILVERCALVDEVFVGLDPAARRIIIDLVRGMAHGMIRSSTIFAEQGGVLRNGDQLRTYCRDVLGLPILYAVRMLHWHHTGQSDVKGDEREDAMLAGEFIQLANVTRDIEKDLRRGIAYDPRLAVDVEAGEHGESSPERAERVREVRADLLVRALELGPAYGRMLDALPLPRFSLGRASGVLMLLFTDRYYRGCARRVGGVPWAGPKSGIGTVAASLPTIVSRRASRRVVERVLAGFASYLGTAPPQGDGSP